MEENKMTIKEVLEITAQTLNEITIPVSLNDLSVPIEHLDGIRQTVKGCVKNLEICINAIKDAEEGSDNGTSADSE